MLGQVLVYSFPISHSSIAPYSLICHPGHGKLARWKPHFHTVAYSELTTTVRKMICVLVIVICLWGQLALRSFESKTSDDF
jgi:hypothetical protein